MTYTVCAYVSVPDSMGYRFGRIGYDAVISSQALEEDCEGDLNSLFYLFDTPDAASEQAAEKYLEGLTGDEISGMMYESKAKARDEFESYRQMFLIAGGLLCAVIGVVGMLNFFNAIMTGILSRRREFAVLQSVGMTSRQLKKMLIYEGLLYVAGAAGAALILSVLMYPLTGHLLETMFWFFSPHFTIVPVLLAIPVFAVLGAGIPAVIYSRASKLSVVERLRQAE